MPNSTEQIQSIEELTRRFQKLDRQRTAVQTRLEDTREQLERLLQQAETEFGTRDVAKLKQKLKLMEEGNAKKRLAYQQELDSIEQQLAAIEQKFSGSDSDGEQNDESH